MKPSISVGWRDRRRRRKRHSDDHAVGSWLLDHLYDFSYRVVYERIKKGTKLEDYLRSLVPTAGQAGPQLTTMYRWARAHVAVRSTEEVADDDRLGTTRNFSGSETAYEGARGAQTR